MYLDKQHPQPVYLQLKEVLQNQIEQGIYFSHQKLPSERDLCQHYNLSRMTARRALQELIADGLAYTRVGKGTFVGHKPGITTKPSPNHTDKQNEDTSGTSLPDYKAQLLDRFLAFDAVGVERTISETLANYSLETVALKLFPEIIRESEQQWQSGEISLSVQNYVINTIRSQLIAMVNAATCEAGPRVLLACAPEDQHEIGLLLLALSLRRRGFEVIYLGLNGTKTEFQQIVEAVKPQLVCFSAITEHAGEKLVRLTRHLKANPTARRHNGKDRRPQETIFTFGGVVFLTNPALISRIPALYLGESIEIAVEKVQELLAAPVE